MSKLLSPLAERAELLALASIRAEAEITGFTNFRSFGYVLSLSINRYSFSFGRNQKSGDQTG